LKFYSYKIWSTINSNTSKDINAWIDHNMERDRIWILS